jgi:hypothetical protein
VSRLRRARPWLPPDRLQHLQAGPRRGVFLQVPRHMPVLRGRRMADTAAHLVDRVIPDVPVRQWVLLDPLAVPASRCDLLPSANQANDTRPSLDDNSNTRLEIQAPTVGQSSLSFYGVAQTVEAKARALLAIRIGAMKSWRHSLSHRDC